MTLRFFFFHVTATSENMGNMGYSQVNPILTKIVGGGNSLYNNNTIIGNMSTYKTILYGD